MELQSLGLPLGSDSHSLLEKLLSCPAFGSSVSLSEIEYWVSVGSGLFGLTVGSTLA